MPKLSVQEIAKKQKLSKMFLVLTKSNMLSKGVTTDPKKLFNQESQFYSINNGNCFDVMKDYLARLEELNLDELEKLFPLANSSEVFGGDLSALIKFDTKSRYTSRVESFFPSSRSHETESLQRYNLFLQINRLFGLEISDNNFILTRDGSKSKLSVQNLEDSDRNSIASAFTFLAALSRKIYDMKKKFYNATPNILSDPISKQDKELMYKMLFAAAKDQINLHYPSNSPLFDVESSDLMDFIKEKKIQALKLPTPPDRPPPPPIHCLNLYQEVKMKTDSQKIVTANGVLITSLSDLQSKILKPILTNISQTTKDNIRPIVIALPMGEGKSFIAQQIFEMILGRKNKGVYARDK